MNNRERAEALLRDCEQADGNEARIVCAEEHIAAIALTDSEYEDLRADAADAAAAEIMRLQGELAEARGRANAATARTELAERHCDEYECLATSCARERDEAEERIEEIANNLRRLADGFHFAGDLSAEKTLRHWIAAHTSPATATPYDAGFAEAIEMAATTCEETDIAVYGTAMSYERPDDGRTTLRNAADAIRALAKPASPTTWDDSDSDDNYAAEGRLQAPRRGDKRTPLSPATAMKEDPWTKCIGCEHYRNEHSAKGECMCLIIKMSGEFICTCKAFVADPDDNSSTHKIGPTRAEKDTP